MNIHKLFIIAVLLAGVPSFAKGLDLKQGDKIAIVSGQSFETYTWSASGYMRLLTEELAKSGVRDAIRISLENQKTAHMLARIDKDVIGQKPAFVLLIPGASDYNAWQEKNVSESFTTNLSDVIEKLQSAHIKTVIATSYAVSCNPSLSLNKNVTEHNDVIHALAKKYNLPLIDFVKVVDDEPKIVPFDGNLAAKALVHQMFAAEVLRTLGYGEKEIADCRKAWLDTPGAVEFMPSVSNNTYAKLKAAAKAAGKDVTDYMAEVVHQKLNAAIK